MKRQVFMISDGTGLTAESLGNSLLTQFESLSFDKQTIPYVNCAKKAESVLQTLNHSFEETGQKPIVFLTSVNPELSRILKASNACILDLFNTFLSPLENELDKKSSYTVGKTHAVSNTESYDKRIEAVNYALSHDDGVTIKEYDRADIILTGVSRCGKTPSCLYLALQFGILAANYPFTDDELQKMTLPEPLKAYKSKLFGLTIDPTRLEQIRSERRPNSQYSSAEQCRIEIAEVEEMYRKEQIPFINSTRFSIEEIATKIVAAAGLKRKV